MQSIGREARTKNHQFSPKCSPDVLGPWGRGEFSDLKFLIENFEFGFEHFKIPPSPDRSEVNLPMENFTNFIKWRLRCTTDGYRLIR